MMKFFILFMTFYVINSQSLIRQNWNWTPEYVNVKPGSFLENTDIALTPPPPPPIPSIDLNSPLDTLIKQLNNLIRLRNERQQEIRQWNQSLLEKQTINGYPVAFDEINIANDPWDVVVGSLIKAIVAVIGKAIAVSII